jgi:hypothetical protein
VINTCWSKNKHCKLKTQGEADKQGGTFVHHFVDAETIPWRSKNKKDGDIL